MITLPLLRVDCGLPWSLREGLNLPLKLRVRAGSRILNRVRVMLAQGEWHEGHADEESGTIKPGEARTAVFNLGLKRAGPVLLKFTVVVLLDEECHLRRFNAVVEMTVQPEVKAGNLAYHVHITGKNVVHGGGQKEGFGQADAVNVSVSLPELPAIESADESTSGFEMQWLEDLALEELELLPENKEIEKRPVWRRLVAVGLALLSLAGLTWKRTIWGADEKKASQSISQSQTQTNRQTVIVNMPGGMQGGGQVPAPTVARSEPEQKPTPEPVTPPIVEKRVFNVSVSKPIYHVGEELKIHVGVPGEGCLYVLGLGGDGKIYLYYPNEVQPNPRFEKAISLDLPEKMAGTISLSFPTVHGLSRSEAIEQVIALFTKEELSFIQRDDDKDQMPELINAGLISVEDANLAIGGHMDHEIPLRLKGDMAGKIATYRVMR